jgi:hypothetical protein
VGGVTANPDGGWVTQQARNFLLVLDERGRRVRFLLCDRDAKFPHSFDDVFRSEGGEVLVTRVRAPQPTPTRSDGCGPSRVPGLAADRRPRPPGAGPWVYTQHYHCPVRAGRWGCRRHSRQPPRPSSAGVTGALCIGATFLVACFTSTGKLHERLYAPFTLTADRCDPGVLLSVVHQGWWSSARGAPPDR